jgi:hypothetical protein
MTRLIGIYIRVSSEAQGEKISPQTQEEDGLALAAEKQGQLAVLRSYQYSDGSSSTSSVSHSLI